MYAATITFPVQTVNPTPETVQMIIVFTNTGTGSPVAYDATAYGLRVADWGKLEWSYDFEDAFLVPGTYSCKIHDKDGLLKSFFFGSGSPWTAYLKTAEVTIKINDVIDYIGDIQEDSISYDVGEKSVSFTCDSRTMILNQTLLFQEDDATPVNQFGLVEGNPYLLTDTLEDIYGLVDSGVSVEIYHDWSMTGLRSGDYHQYDGFEITDVLLTAQLLFFAPALGMRTMGDVLKRLATDWCCYTGLIHKKRAFFKKLFYFDAANQQTLGMVHNRVLNYRYGLLDYVTFTCTYGGYTISFSQGTNSHIDDRLLSKQQVMMIPGIQNAGNVTAVIVGGDDAGTYVMYSVSDPSVDAGAACTSAEVAAKFWFNQRGSLLRSRIDSITTSGIGYDFLKNFIDDGRKYQPITMTKQIADSITQIDAIYLGDV